MEVYHLSNNISYSMDGIKSCWIYVPFMFHWDVYPFILLNLLFSTQAAYAAPIIMMSQNRQNIRDRLQAEEDYKTNKDAKLEIEELSLLLKSIEVEKLDKIIELLLEQKDITTLLKNKPLEKE